MVEYKYKITEMTDSGTIINSEGKTEVKINEDSYYSKALGKNTILIMVADGVGGMSAGEVASNFVKESIKSWVEEQWSTLKKLDKNTFLNALHEELLKINNDLITICDEKDKKMGSTIALILLTKKSYIVASVGDSRVYLINDGEIKRITKDQTLAQRLIDEGVMTIEEAFSSKEAHVLTQCIGTEGVVPAYYEDNLPEGELYIIACTDGFYNRNKDEEIKVLMGENKVLEKKLQQLIKQARERGEKDNITVTALRRVEER